MRSLGKWMWCGILIASAGSYAPAQTPSGVTDYDKRAAAALRSMMAGKPQALDAVGEKEVRSLTRFETKTEAGRHSAVYAMNFGALQNGVDSQGFMRINIGGGEPDVKGWTSGSRMRSKAHGVDMETFYRMIEASGSLPARMTVGIRCRIGGLLLTIAQRRPPGEDVNAGLFKLFDRMEEFIGYAKTYKLFLGEWQFSVVSRNGVPLSVSEPLTFSLADDKDTLQVVRVRYKTPDGVPAPAFKRVKVRLSGPLAPLVSWASGGKAVKGEGVLDLPAPSVDFEVRMTLPSQKAPEVMAAVRKQLEARAASDKPAAPIRFQVVGLTEVK